jgi:uncharacterized coiled-coil protein SlyX
MQSTIEKKLDLVIDKLTALEITIATQTEKANSLEKIVAGHTMSIDGAGQPGMKTKIELLRLSDSKQNTFIGLVGGASLVEIFAIIGGLLTHSIHIP